MRCLARVNKKHRCSYPASFIFCTKHRNEFLNSTTLYWRKIISIIASIIAFWYYFTGQHLASDTMHSPKINESKIIASLIEPFNISSENFNIMIFPFQPLEKCAYKKTEIEKTIITRLYDLSYNDNLKLKIIFNTIDCIHTYEDADSIMKKYNANLVIWGDLYEHCSSDAKEACIKFVNSSSNSSSTINKPYKESVIEPINSLVEVTQGKLMNNIDYIIYWAAAYRSYLKDDFDNAIRYLKIAEKLGNTPQDLILNLATTNLACGYYTEAKTYYEKFLSTNPEMLPALKNYTILLVDKFQLKKEVDSIYKKYLVQFPANALIYAHYAYLQDFYFHNIRVAQEYYEKAIKLDTANKEIHLDYINFLLRRQKNIVGAINIYKKVLQIYPNDSEIHFEYGAFLCNNLIDIAEGKKQCEIAIQISQNNPVYLANYGYILAEDFGDYNQAIIYYQKALKIDFNNSMGHLACAKIYDNNLNNFKLAKYHYEASLRINPYNGETHESYAMCLGKRFKELKVAKMHFEVAINIDPLNTTWNNNYGVFLDQSLNDPNLSRIHYEKAIKNIPNSDKLHTGFARLLYSKFKDVNGTLDHLEKALNSNSNNAEAHYHYALLVLTRLLDRKTAMFHYLKAIQLDPKYKTKEIEEIFSNNSNNQYEIKY